MDRHKHRAIASCKQKKIQKHDSATGRFWKKQHFQLSLHSTDSNCSICLAIAEHLQVWWGWWCRGNELCRSWADSAETEIPGHRCGIAVVRPTGSGWLCSSWWCPVYKTEQNQTEYLNNRRATALNCAGCRQQGHLCTNKMLQFLTGGAG